MQPSQWRTKGVRVPLLQQAVLLWRRCEEPALSEASLRARRAFDALAERGTPLRADSTARGIEVILPLEDVAAHLGLLAEWSILPDAVLVAASAPREPAARLMAAAKVVGGLEIEVGEPAEDRWLAELRQAAWLDA